MGTPKEFQEQKSDQRLQKIKSRIFDQNL